MRILEKYNLAKKISSAIVLIGCMFGMSSCDSDIWDDQMSVVASDPVDVQSKIKEAYKAGKAISSVAPVDNQSGYVIDFSDGHRLTIKPEQPAGKLVIPYLKIDWEGNWCATFDGEQSSERFCDEAGLPVAADAFSASFGVTNEGKYVIEGLSRDNYDSAVNFETAHAVEQENTIRSIVEDKIAERLTIEMTDGKSFDFGLSVVRPTAVTAQTKNVNLGHNIERAIEFSLKPEDAFLPIKMSGDGANVRLVLEDEALEECVELISIEPLTDDSGKIIEGSFVAHIRDREVKSGYETTGVIRVNTEQSAIDVDALESDPVGITRGCGVELDWLKVGGVDAVDNGDGAFMVKLPYGVNLKSVSVEYASDAMSVVAEGYDDDVQDCESIDFSRPVKLLATSFTGEIKEYTAVVHFSNLPVVYMETPSAITSKDIWTADCEMQIWNAGEDDAIYQKANVKGRGNSTWKAAKKPYAIKLDKKAEVLGMPKHKRWVLLANYNDRTDLRTEISMDLGRRTGLDYTPRTKFVELVMNGTYQGLYQITEQLKIDENRVDVGDDGFLLEIDGRAGEDPDDVYFRDSRLSRNIVIKDPDVAYGSDDFEYVKGYVASVSSALYALGNDNSSQAYLDLIDVPSFVDWYLVNEITRNADACTLFSSCYMNLKRGEKLKMGPLWDFDLAVGNYIFGANMEYNSPTGFSLRKTMWYGSLYKSPEFVSELKLKFEALYNSRESLYLNIRSQRDYIREAYICNEHRWHGLAVGADYSVVNNNFDTRVEEVITWLETRFNWMKNEFDQL